MKPKKYQSTDDSHNINYTTEKNDKEINDHFTDDSHNIIMIDLQVTAQLERMIRKLMINLQVTATT